jgi:NAD(P)-dependent dehydrogenase (short-subunit alcohol dehydrogenase family)
MKKTILITGSSTGIGRAAVRFFHLKGWNVVATMRNPDNETEFTQKEDILVVKLDADSLTTCIEIV